MNCSRCNTQNEEAAKFCRNCGYNLSYLPTGDGEKSNKYQTLLIVIGLFIVFETFFWATYNLLRKEYWEPIKYLSVVLGIFFSSIPIIIGIILNNKAAKILLIILGVLALCASIYNHTRWW